MLLDYARCVINLAFSRRQRTESPSEVSHKIRISQLCVGITVSLWLMHLPLAFSQATEKEQEEWVATLVSVDGTVERRRAQQADWSPAALNDEFRVGDSVRVQAFSRAAIRLPD